MPDLSVADNISIAAPPRRFGLIDARAQRRRAEALLAEVGCEDVNPLLRVRDLPLSRRQMVEIAKALGQKPQLLILDEATSALTSADVEKVYSLLARLKTENVAILYITHRMHEVEALADRASVFRNGRHIETFDKGARSTAEIVQLMIGRDIATQYPPKPKRARPAAALKVDRLGWENSLESISLEVGAGEIVGLGGLDGQGQKTLLARALRRAARRYRLNHGQRASRAAGIPGPSQGGGNPHRSRSRGPENGRADAADVGLRQPDDRFAGRAVVRAVRRFQQGGGRSRGRRQAPSHQDRREDRRRLDAVSGGNQQKVVIAKWLMTEPRVILLNDPTRGIDVGTKQELYRLMRELADQGAAILFYSTDYDELIGCCDRVAIMYDGRIVRELAGDELNETNIVASSLNIEGAGGGERGSRVRPCLATSRSESAKTSPS